MTDEGRLERLSGMLRRRGFLLPAFEIHGGAKGLYDFGPVGGRMRSRVNQRWLDHWLQLGNVVELSCPTVTPYAVLEASGHVGEFSDFMTECGACGEASRADTLLEDHHPNPDALKRDELERLLFDVQPACPACGNRGWGEVKAQNLMFNTTIGAGDSGRPGFLRPETAQGMFTSFNALHRHFRERLPFGAMQVGKGYRNEIAPRQGMIRLREFNMAELEYFIDPAATLTDDLSPWDDRAMQLIADGGETMEMTLSEACKQQLIRHSTVARLWESPGIFLLMLASTLPVCASDSTNKTRWRITPLTAGTLKSRAATGGLSASGLLTGVATTSRATKRQRAKRCALVVNLTNLEPSRSMPGPSTGQPLDRRSRPLRVR